MKRLVSLLFFPIAHFLPAQVARQATLAETLELAAANSTALKKAALDRQGLEQRINEERSVIYPQVSADFDLDAYPLLPTQLIPGEFFNRPGSYLPVRFGQPWHLSSSVRAEQLLFNEGYRRAIPARDMSRALFDLMTQKTSEDVVFNTAGLFYQCLQAAELRRSVESNLEKLNALQKIAQLQLNNGYATPTDVKRISVAKTNLETQLQNLLANIEALQNTLKFMCGVPLEQPFVPTALMANPLADTARWQSLKLETGALTEHRILQKGMDLLRLRTRALRGERYPTASAYASGLLQSQRGNANFFDGSGRWFGMLVFGIKVRLPIFDGYRRVSKASQLDLDWLKMDEDRKQLDEGKKLEFATAQSQFQSAVRLLTVQGENVELAREIRDKLMLQYKEGVLPLSDLLNTQTALSEAETNYWQQVFAYKLAALKLAKAAGRPDLVTE